MNVIFLDVENVLNYKNSEAKSPTGRLGIASSCIYQLRKIINDTHSFVVLTGDWKKDWNFDESKCTKDGIYLNNKFFRNGIRILDKVRQFNTEKLAIEEWLSRHSEATHICILTSNKTAELLIKFSDYICQTPLETGLSSDITDKIKNILLKTL